MKIIRWARFTDGGEIEHRRHARAFDQAPRANRGRSMGSTDYRTPLEAFAASHGVIPPASSFAGAHVAIQEHAAETQRAATRSTGSDSWSVSRLFYSRQRADYPAARFTGDEFFMGTGDGRARDEQSADVGRLDDLKRMQACVTETYGERL